MAKLRTFPLAALAVIVAGCAAREPGPAVGDTLPKFSLASSDSPLEKIDISAYKGHPILIDIWATWCPPCREELPHIEKIWSDNKDRGLIVLAVTTEDVGAVNAFRAEQKSQIPMYLDADNSANRALGISGYPTTIIVGKDGRIQYSSVGFDPGGESELNAAVAQALL
jgi:peroxiredoxin